MSATFRLVLEYDGSGFCGWQRQPGVRTVEGVLREAAAALGLQVESLSAAGRTDAGAHAHGQVVGLSVDIPNGWEPEPLRHALNAHLPRDVVVVSASAAPADFHARRDALTRTYRYLVVPRTNRQAVARQYAWQVRGPLDLALMRRAAKLLEGTHDFSAFGRSPRPGGTTTRTVHAVKVRRISGAIVIDVSANAFLYGMMRSFAGALVGEHRMQHHELHALLTHPPKQRANLTVAPAHGLHQWAVTYPEIA
jgi:tRNA pseudouridine38-40 synthase